MAIAYGWYKLPTLRILVLAITFHLFYNLSFSLNVTIISSQPVFTNNDMDAVWMEVASNMGHNAIIVPQATLANNLFFSSTDILIVSSATIGLLNDEEDVILEFIKTGKPVYLQTEYNPYLTTNIAFQYIIGALGGEFSWQNMFSYDLEHVNVLGSYSNTPNDVKSINYFFHSVSGKGDCNTIPFLEHAGEFHGFQYIPDNQDYGSIITATDQDWIWERTSLPLMENILMHLISPPAIPEENKINLGNDTVLCVGDALVLEIKASQGDFKWQDDSNLSFYTVTKAGQYWVNANLSCGLVTDTIAISTVYCNCKLYLPNIFSPEDNGLNDIFNPESNCPFSSYRILIFNRWGNLVFESNDPFDHWDGIFKGKLAPAGVYAYFVEYAYNYDETISTSGDLTLLR